MCFPLQKQAGLLWPQRTRKTLFPLKGWARTHLHEWNFPSSLVWASSFRSSPGSFSSSGREGGGGQNGFFSTAQCCFSWNCAGRVKGLRRVATAGAPRVPLQIISRQRSLRAASPPFSGAGGSGERESERAGGRCAVCSNGRARGGGGTQLGSERALFASAPADGRRSSLAGQTSAPPLSVLGPSSLFAEEHRHVDQSRAM